MLYDGAKVRWDSIDIDTPLPGLSTINLANADLDTDLLNGALLYLARPGEAVDRHMETNVLDTTSKTIVIDDPTGAFAGALAEATDDPTHFAPPIEDFVIFAFNDSKVPNAPTYQTQGTWTSGPSTGSGKTKFTDAEADDNGGGFASWMVGCLLVPDVNIGAPLVIVNVPSATEVEVGGTATGVGSNGSLGAGITTQYLAVAAPFTDPAHGTLQTDAFKAGSPYLWAGYRYQPPQMGFWVDPPGGPSLGVYGAATGTNRLGQYYAWNRTYDINTGRWTTPDPAATPWWNLNAYGPNPIGYLDPSGNGIIAVIGPCIAGAVKSLIQDKINEWFLDSEFSLCEKIFSAVIGCVFAYVGPAGALADAAKVTLWSEIKQFILELAVGSFFGNLCEWDYGREDPRAKSWLEFLRHPSKFVKQVHKKAGELGAKPTNQPDPEREKTKAKGTCPGGCHENPTPSCPTPPKMPPSAPVCPPGDKVPAEGDDASAWFDPKTVQGPGASHKVCVDQCWAVALKKYGSVLREESTRASCAKSCTNAGFK